jgi:excisionase family DNA binding protein
MDDHETPLFVRLPPRIAERLDRAAFELRLSKKELVTALLSRHMDDDELDGPDRLRQIHEEVEHFRTAGGLPGKRKLLVHLRSDADGPLPDGPPAHAGVGNATFRSFDTPEVLTLEDAAELLQVAPGELQALAVAGEIPARRIGESWRLSRVAVLRWLGDPPA